MANWKDEHRRLYPDDEPTPEPTTRQLVEMLEGTVFVSPVTEELFQDYEIAVMLFAAAQTEEVTAETYAVLCQRRQEIYEHLADLEEIVGRHRTVRKRFL